jgi:hypothetical protein
MDPCESGADEDKYIEKAPRRSSVRVPTPLPSSPALQQFIDAVIIPALLEQLLREDQSAA